MQIPIDIEVLKSVLSIDDKAARQKIDQTDGVRINDDTPIEWKRENQRITVKVPTNLGDSLLIIDLIDEHGETTTLAYDQKAKEFRHPKPAASPPTNPQADTRRDFELALQVGNVPALNAFLAQHPKGYHANLAKAQLEKIVAEEAAAKKS